MGGVTVDGCLLISGMPGAGKSTVSWLVAASLPRSARIRGDDVHEMIVSGRSKFGVTDAEEARRQGKIRYRNISLLARTFAEAGFIPVVDDVIPDREVLGSIVDQLRPLPLRLVVLAPPVEVCEQRNRERPAPDRVDFDIAPHEAAMRAELGGVGWWIDNQNQTPEVTAATIIEAIRTVPPFT